MRWLSVRLVGLGLLCCATGLLGFAVAASATDPGAPHVPAPPPLPVSLGNPQPTSLANPFPANSVVSPEQADVNQASRSAFTKLGRDAAGALARKDFHLQVPAWSSPIGAEGARVDKYVGATAAAETLPGGHHVLVSSTVPLRTTDAAGDPAPVSLTLHEGSEGYVPQNPVVPVVIAKQAAGGLALPQGIRVTPVTSENAEAPTVIGNSVMFANEGTDMDFIEEPLPYGAEISWQLRSEQSDASNSVRFDLPAGAALVMSKTMPGSVEISQAGKRLLLVPPASARDASGKQVPTSYSIRGNVLTTEANLSEPVEFPILVDPDLIFVGAYGVVNGSGSWAGWEHSLTGNFELYEESTGLEALSPHGNAYDSQGEFYIYAPGPQGLPGSAGITRVDLSDINHESHEESEAYAEIGESNGADPIYSFDGAAEDALPAPLGTLANLNQAIVFCAQWAGGYEGDPNGQPLCNETEKQGKYFVMDDIIATEGGTANYNDIRATGAAVTYRDATAPNKVVLNDGGYNGEWLKVAPAGWSVSGEDEGLGIHELKLEIPAGNEHGAYFTEAVNCTGENGFAGCPRAQTSAQINLEGAMPATGVYEPAAVAVDAADNVSAPASARTKVYIDKTPPVISELKGTLYEHANGLIGGRNYTFSFGATDGTETEPQSGVYSLEVKVDGKQADTITTRCSRPHALEGIYCLDLSGSWTMNGQAYGAGQHTITLIARDWAGNESSTSFTVTVNEASYTPVGPGAVNLATGDYKVSADDVSIAAGATTLGVERTYDSRNLTQGATGPLGPQWALSTSGSSAAEQWQSLNVRSNGSVVLYDTHGDQVTFLFKGGKYISPPGYQTATVTEPSISPAEYQIADAHGNWTRFAQPAAESPFEPDRSGEATAAGGINVVTYSYTKTAEGVVEPTEVLAPEPTAGACTSKLVQGCRALTFVYASSTGAKEGEERSDWGTYKGRLVTVDFTAWEPVKGEMSKPIAVAEYAYDARGQLRAEWDPRVTPTPLKTSYGYDSEGHLTAISPPGQEPWVIHYGAIASDSNAGRLLSVARFKPETALWSGEALTNKTSPTLSTPNPVVGVQLSASNGTWSSTAVAYSYQWERCSAGVCTSIAGATSPTYTPILVDTQTLLRVTVTATNAGGSLGAKSVESNGVALQSATFSFAFASSGFERGEVEEPAGIAIAPVSGDVWVADAMNNRVDEYSSNGTFLRALGWGVETGKEKYQQCEVQCKPGIAGNSEQFGQLDNPEGVAISPGEGALYVASDNYQDIQKIGVGTEGKWTSAKTEFGAPQTGDPLGLSSSVHGLAVDASGDLWVADTNHCRVVEYSSTGVFIRAIGEAGTGHGQFEGTMGVAIDGNEVFVTDIENDRVQVFTLTGTWVREFGGKGTQGGKFEYPWAIATDGLNGNVDVSSLDGRVQEFTPEGKYVEEFGHWGSEKEEFDNPTGLGINPITGALYIADEYNNRIDVWAPKSQPTEEPIQPAPSPGITSVTTVDYQIPLSGTAVPLQREEVAKWNETDDPEEATAVFPPTEPQGWPASEYKRASVFYLDNEDRTVNTALPGGAISTTQYAKTSTNVEWSLSPDNRATALKETEGTSEQMAKVLETEDKYSPEEALLTSTLGPQHTVALANGTRTLARKHNQYFYEESAPSGGPYDLVTKSIESATLPSGEEVEARTVKTSYSGQSNLGWRLHAPTSAETSDGTEQLTTNTTYEESTGEVTETSTPKGSEGDQPTLYSHFRTPGESSFAPSDIAREPGGGNNLWVLDDGSSHIEEFSGTEQMIGEFGEGGTKLGAFKEADSLAVSPKGTIFIADTENHRIEEYSAAETPVAVLGEGVTNGEHKSQKCTSGCEAGLVGVEPGEFGSPEGIAVDASGDVWVSDTTNGRIEEFNENLEYVKTITSGGDPEDLAFDTHGNLWVANSQKFSINEYTPAGSEKSHITVSQFPPHGIAIGTNNTIWTAGAGTESIVEGFTEVGERIGAYHSHESAGTRKAVGVAADTEHDLWFADESGTIKRLIVPSPAAGAKGAHTSQTIYYSASANTSYPKCGKHPEWAGLPCRDQRQQQPESGLPKVPESEMKYNVWDEPLTTEDSAGSASRTTTLTYDGAGRLVTSSISATEDKALPPVTNEYSAETGALVKQSTPTQSLTSAYNRVGQLTNYSDANGNVAKYEYETGGAERLTKLTDGEKTAAESTTTYGYNATTDLPEIVKDSGAGTFTTLYDIEGHPTTEEYPGGLDATYRYNAVGALVSQEDNKTTHCTAACKWYADSIVPSIHEQWLTQESTYGTDAYRYDELGRLVENQETPAGGGCTDRTYAYDEDGNRTSAVTREPNSEHKCASEGGHAQVYEYDTADRLEEQGVSYDAFGNTTGLPAIDAGGWPLKNTYYVDDALASQEQDGVTLSYALDPAGRTGETVATGKTSATVVSHYAGAGTAPAWTTTATGTWTRNIAGATGRLIATETKGKAPELELSDLHGDIVATATTSETETKLTPTKATTEFGVSYGTTPTYDWLGADMVATEMPTGIVSMGARTYIPQLGRFEQTDPQPGGSANAYAYTDDDPVNQADVSGQSTTTITYNYAAAECGSAAGGLPEIYAAPGAVFAPPVDLQVEAAMNAHPPWDAVSVLVSMETGAEGEGAVAAVGFDHTWEVQPDIACAIGEAIALGGSEIGTYAAGFVFIPSWFHKVIDAMTGGQLEHYANELMLAGDQAAPGTLVSINAWGSFRLGVHIDVSWWVARGD